MNKFVLHLVISTFGYMICAFADIYLTLLGMEGDLLLEGNPLIRQMMVIFGPLHGLVLEKMGVYLFALSLAAITFKGIDNKSNWVYALALTSFTRNWMKRKKRYVVAFLPIYLVAFSQGLAAVSWLWIMNYT